MGWFDGWWGSSDSNGSDPLRRLDPKLREFLEKESPVKYNPSATEQISQPPSAPPPPQQQQPTTQTTDQQGQQQDQQQPPAVPTLFPDGRYAHLWKTYRPLAVIEAETKSDNEKLHDVIEAYKDRKGQIGRAALENCAYEQGEWTDCLKSGTMRARMTLCRDEVHKFERCYNAQSRLLKALGYLSVHGRSPDVDEEIQMRADELYHRMLAQEKEAEKARAEGREVPVFKSVFDDKAGLPLGGGGGAAVGKEAGGGGGAGADYPEPSAAVLAAWKEKLDKLPPDERLAEEAALRAEHRANVDMMRQVQGLWQEQAREREKRKAEGKATLMDKFRDLVGMGVPPKSN